MSYLVRDLLQRAIRKLRSQQEIEASGDSAIMPEFTLRRARKVVWVSFKRLGDVTYGTDLIDPLDCFIVTPTDPDLKPGKWVRILGITTFGFASASAPLTTFHVFTTAPTRGNWCRGSSYEPLIHYEDVIAYHRGYLCSGYFGPNQLGASSLRWKWSASPGFGFIAENDYFLVVPIVFNIYNYTSNFWIRAALTFEYEV